MNNHPKQTIKRETMRRKIKRAAASAGQEVIEKALLLYYTMRDPKTPAWCKGVILGALGYFISMIDGIPDLTPLLGYTDDLSVMIAAISTISGHISDENIEKAQHKAAQIFSRQSGTD